jgi:hypothetical protein
MAYLKRKKSKNKNKRELIVDEVRWLSLSEAGRGYEIDPPWPSVTTNKETRFLQRTDS